MKGRQQVLHCFPRFLAYRFPQALVRYFSPFVDLSRNSQIRQTHLPTLQLVLSAHAPRHCLITVILLMEQWMLDRKSRLITVMPFIKQGIFGPQSCILQLVVQTCRRSVTGGWGR